MRPPATLAVLLLAATVYSQVISNLPQCWQSCIHNSGDFNCNDLDIPCKLYPNRHLTSPDIVLTSIGICRLSNGNFLTDIVTCVKGNCDYQLDSNLFITPLQLACSLAGTPISSAAIRNAEFVETQGGNGGQATTTTTMEAASQRVSTMTVTAAPATHTITSTSTTTDSRGSTFYILVPITVQQGSTSTTSTSSVTTTTVVAVPATTTTSTSGQSAAQNAGSTLSTSTTTTTVTPATIILTTATSATNVVVNSPVASTNGSPFGMQSAGTRKEGSSWLGLMIGLVAGVAWF